jgi:hypothetical protein
MFRFTIHAPAVTPRSSTLGHSIIAAERFSLAIIVVGP